MNEATISHGGEGWDRAMPSTDSSDDPVSAELARYLPLLSRMSTQLRETSAQIESSVVGVCSNFQEISVRAKETVGRARGFLGGDTSAIAGSRSFESLIEGCRESLVQIMCTTQEASEASRRAIERMQKVDRSAHAISAAMQQFEQIAAGNKILALNARIQAAHAGSQGVGFSAVAVEVLSQTQRSQELTEQVGDLIADLRGLAESTLEDLRRTDEQSHQRTHECRVEVDRSLADLHSAHGEMKGMLNNMSNDGEMLASDSGSAIRALQFQDRISQRIGHVVEDLETLHERLEKRFGAEAGDADFDKGFSAYTMNEERQVAGSQEIEAGAGEVELF